MRSSVGVGAGNREGTSVLDLCNEACWEASAGVSPRSGRTVREGGRYALCKGMGNGIASGGENES